jgi:hypothetical protein
MAWWRGETHWSDGSDPSDTSARAARLHSATARSSQAESARLSLLTSELVALPAHRLQGRAEEIAQWPPGTARELALALLAARLAPPDAPAPDPLAEQPEDAEPGPNAWEKLTAALQSGSVGEARDPFVAGGDLFPEWTALDPAAASAAILDMPSGTARGEAVDTAAAVMARTDPQAAWDFVLKAGEKFPGIGSARAWLNFIGTREGDQPPLAQGLSLTQQESLAAALTQLVKGSPEVSPGTESMAGDDELAGIVTASLSLASSPARRELAEAIAERDHNALFLGMGFRSFRDPGSVPEDAALTASGLLAMLDPQHSLGLPWLTELGKGEEFSEHSPADLTAAAPRLLPAMARAGHVREAVELYRRIPDADARRAALEGLLPAWMDTDPQAARAAFHAAPFTALEREKWQRHPAFLLHPADEE